MDARGLSKNLRIRLPYQPLRGYPRRPIPYTPVLQRPRCMPIQKMFMLCMSKGIESTAHVIRLTD
jgi:hypothetical protein